MHTLTERRPHHREGFQRLPAPITIEGALNVSRWGRGPLVVISAVEIAELPDRSGEVGPQWHITLSSGRARPSDRELRRVIRAFEVPTPWDEDNHHPGIARHIWVPIEASRRRDCECKATERVVVEPDGYRWSTPKDAEAEGCAGCYYESTIGRLMSPPVRCPIHTTKTVAAP